MDIVCDRYKAHLLRKTWDRLAQAKMFGRVGANEAAVIIDYGLCPRETTQNVVCPRQTTEANSLSCSYN